MQPHAGGLGPAAGHLTALVQHDAAAALASKEEAEGAGAKGEGMGEGAEEEKAVTAQAGGEAAAEAALQVEEVKEALVQQLKATAGEKFEGGPLVEPAETGEFK